MKIESGSRLVTFMVVLLSAFSIGTFFLSERAIEQRRLAQQNYLDTTKAIQQLIKGNDTLTNAIRVYAISGDKQHRAFFLGELEVDSRSDAIRRLRKLLSDYPDELALLVDAKHNSDGLVEFQKQALAIAERGNYPAAVAMILGPEHRAKQSVVNGSIDLALDLLDNFQRDRMVQLSARADLAGQIAWGTMTLNVFGMLVVLFWFYRHRVVEPLVRITRQAQQLIAGQRNVRFVGPQTASEAIEIGELAKTLASYQDMAIALNAQKEELRLANAEHQAIVDSATSGIALIKEREIYRANHKLHEIFGWPPGEIVGQPTRIWYADEASSVADERILYAPIWRGETSTHEIQMKRRDGRYFWARIVGRAVDINDSSRGSVWIIDDVTVEHAAIEEMRKARALAEDAVRMKSDFLANMSHEIRTPMNAIIGMAYLALKTDPTPHQRDYLKKIQASSQLLLGIINDILDLSKIEAGKMMVEHTDFELQRVLDNVTNLIAEKAAGKGLELIIDVADNVPSYLVGDSLRLGQVLVNYANNAVKFTERGEIEISVALARVLEDAVFLRFSVRDTGIGLSEEQQGRLFKSFEQADTSTTRKYGGTGLGLVIAKQLVELMEGQVGVESKLGQGSSFWFTARFGFSQMKVRSLQPNPELRGRRLLVVDDSDTAREVIGEMLRSMSFAATTVSSGAAAVDEIAKAAAIGDPYEMAFLDWQMPQMDGLATAGKIRELGLDHPPHLAIITSYGRDELFKSAAAAGVDDVLIKPLSTSLLFDTVMRFLGAALVENQPQAVTVSSVESRMSSIAGARILLVEDNDMNQQVAAELLEGVGLSVEIAENGLIALEKVRQATYAIVLMDMQMPVMDGLTATQEIRKLPECINLPIIAMTANAMQEDKDKCLEAGMQDYVAKPIEPDDLWRALLKWVKPDAVTTRLPAISTVSGRGQGTGELPGEIAGLDMPLGLKRALGKRALYLTLLRKFMRGQAAAPARIKRALEIDDWLDAERLTHTLKGTAATIGATAIQERCARLEASIRSHEARSTIDSLVDEVSSVLTLTVKAMRESLPSESSASRKIEFDPRQLNDLATRLAALLADDDAESNDLLAQHTDMFRAAFGDRYQSIEEAVHNFEFDLALTALQAAMQEPQSIR